MFVDNGSMHQNPRRCAKKGCKLVEGSLKVAKNRCWRRLGKENPQKRGLDPENLGKTLEKPF